MDFTTASGWLQRLVRPLGQLHTLVMRNADRPTEEKWDRRANTEFVASRIRATLRGRMTLETAHALGLTIIRRENPAFNYGFFRPNLLSFPGIDQKTVDHGRNFSRSSEPEQASLNLLLCEA